MTNAQRRAPAHPFRRFDVQLFLLLRGTREQLIRWHEWNDPNGDYCDDASAAQGMPPITRGQLQELLFRSLVESL